MPGPQQFIGWYYNDAAGKEVGPITTAELSALVAAGKLQPSQMVTKAYSDGQKTHRHLTRVSTALSQSADPATPTQDSDEPRP